MYSLDSCLTGLVNRYMKIGDVEYLLENIDRKNKKTKDFFEDLELDFELIHLDCPVTNRLCASIITTGDLRLFSVLFELRSDILPKNIISAIKRYVTVTYSRPINHTFTEIFYNSVLRFGSLDIVKFFRERIILEWTIKESDLDISMANPDRRVFKHLRSELREEKLHWIREYRKCGISEIEFYEGKLSEFEERYGSAN